MYKFSSLLDQLAREGWAVSQDFLPRVEIEALADEARRFWELGSFGPAGIGRSLDFSVRTEIRSDYIYWLDEQSASRLQQKYLEEIEGFRRELNRNLFAGLTDFEAHFACYPPGAFYRRHLDRFKAADERIISCTLYLNANWREEDRGALRIYTESAHAGFLDILPRAGVFVAFRSDTIFHEVLPATKERLSLTGWLKRRSRSIL
ncbi:MAG TPA: 2OG-Fe(II) oxygenase [Pyrinomonadaceae bacterium]|jgi:SM-20-related protein